MCGWWLVTIDRRKRMGIDAEYVTIMRTDRKNFLTAEAAYTKGYEQAKKDLEGETE